MYTILESIRAPYINLETDVELRGGIWYKRSSGIVTRVTPASLRILYMNAGPNVTPFAQNFRFNSYVTSNRKGYFWAQCHYYATAESGGTTVNFDFGKMSYAFIAEP